MERICHNLRELASKHTKIDTVAGDALHGTMVDLLAPAEPVENTTGRRSITINNHRSNVDKTDTQEIIEAQNGRSNNLSRAITQTTRIKSYPNAR